MVWIRQGPLHHSILRIQGLGRRWQWGCCSRQQNIRRRLLSAGKGEGRVSKAETGGGTSEKEDGCVWVWESPGSVIPTMVEVNPGWVRREVWIWCPAFGIELKMKGREVRRTAAERGELIRLWHGSSSYSHWVGTEVPRFISIQKCRNEGLEMNPNSDQTKGQMGNGAATSWCEFTSQ